MSQKKKPLSQRAEAGMKKKSPPGFAWGLGNQNGISEEAAASAGAGVDASSAFGFALPLTEKSVTTIDTFS